jgi:hypothetical protein
MVGQILSNNNESATRIFSLKISDLNKALVMFVWFRYYIGQFGSFRGCLVGGLEGGPSPNAAPPVFGSLGPQSGLALPVLFPPSEPGSRAKLTPSDFLGHGSGRRSRERFRPLSRHLLGSRGLAREP